MNIICRPLDHRYLSGVTGWLTNITEFTDDVQVADTVGILIKVMDRLYGGRFLVFWGCGLTGCVTHNSSPATGPC